MNVLTAATAGGTPMECGARVNVCGIITLESGLGDGVYAHKEPSVHGLWPEVGTYGTSSCIAPSQSTADPTRVYSCYECVGGARPVPPPAKHCVHICLSSPSSFSSRPSPGLLLPLLTSGITGTTAAGQLAFETHEWGKHGVCAGVKDANDYFAQICNISADPVATMKTVRDNGGDLAAMQAALVAANYSVWSVDAANEQLELSACLKQGPIASDWIIAAVADFEDACGSDTPKPPAPAPGPAPGPPTPPGKTCVPGAHGPVCSADADCNGVTGCIRCAHSGFCTNVPLASHYLRNNTTTATH